METIEVFTVEVVGLFEKGWNFAGWWFLGGLFVVFVCLCLATQRAPYR